MPQILSTVVLSEPVLILINQASDHPPPIFSVTIAYSVPVSQNFHSFLSLTFVKSLGQHLYYFVLIFCKVSMWLKSYHLSLLYLCHSLGSSCNSFTWHLFPKPFLYLPVRLLLYGICSLEAEDFFSFTLCSPSPILCLIHI